MSFEQFSTNPLVRGLSPGLIREFFEIGDERSIGKGELIMNEGDPPNHLYVILKGEFEAFLPLTEDRPTKVRLDTLGPGGCVGEYGLIDHQPASASVKAKTDGLVFHVLHEDLENFLNQRHEAGCVIYRNLMIELVRRLRMSNSELDLFAYPMVG